MRTPKHPLSILAACALPLLAISSCSRNQSVPEEVAADASAGGEGGGFVDARKFPRLVDEWVKVPPIGTIESDWLQANHSGLDWKVFLEGSNVIAVRDYLADSKWPRPPFIEDFPDSMFQGLACAIKVDDGWLTGFNEGEWGGSLEWFSEDGKERYLISADNVSLFLTLDDDIYVAQGLSHLGASHGSISIVSKALGQKKWTIREVVDLGASPAAVVVDPQGRFVVVTNQQVLRVTPEGEVCVVVEEGAWWCLYPNSSVLKDDVLYIGMRQRIAKISSMSTTPVVEYFVPNEHHVLKSPVSEVSKPNPRR